MDEMTRFHDTLEGRKNIDQNKADLLFYDLKKKLDGQQEVAVKFGTQLRSIVAKEDYKFFLERLEAGIAFFSQNIDTDFIVPLKQYHDELLESKRTKKVRRELNELIDLFTTLPPLFAKARVLAEKLLE
jgi:hypothetical protein